ncbi:MAG TPA: hypothetical protein PKD32_09810 [Saprospiraceae bacterium]|nr:hypothetical protein [Saprospiraceae bacterium]
MFRFVIILFLLMIDENLHSQGLSSVDFRITCHSEDVLPGQNYVIEGDTLIFDKLKFYITHLELFENDSLVLRSDEKAYLLDMSDASSLSIPLQFEGKFNLLRFRIGIDSLLNVSGVLDGVLDPTKGMYWTWQSGYINFKLEGRSSICPARRHKFYWHIGGYLTPYQTQQEVSLDVKEDSNICVLLALDELVRRIDLTNTYQVMSPGEPAVKIADDLVHMFKTCR